LDKRDKEFCGYRVRWDYENSEHDETAEEKQQKKEADERRKSGKS
jgi:hypothetical protein